MSTVLQEVTDDTIERPHIVQRVDDWDRRIRNLFADIEAWLPSGWVAEQSRTIPLNEEMMREFGVPPRALPILDLIRDGERVASIEPRVLWMIGANGRLDLICGNGHFLIVDSADVFDPAKWMIAPLSNRRDLKAFDSASFRMALASE